MMRYGPGVALVVVDMQNDFADPGGSLTVAGAPSIVPVVNAQVASARANHALIVFTQDWHPKHTPHFARDGGVWPVHCVADTWGAALHPDLVVDGPIVRKGANGEDGYSGFTMRDPLGEATVATELAGLLRERGVASVVVCGLATDYCVLATALDAVELGFATSLLLDGARAVDLAPGDGDRAIARMAAAGVALIRP